MTTKPARTAGSATGKSAGSSGNALTALKQRVKRPSAPGAEPSPELPERHESMDKALRRRMPFLFDPRDMPTVLEIGGPAPVGDHSEFYITALVDGHRQVTPPGCTTPTMKTLWTKGQHVRRDVYATYVAELPEDQRAAALGEPEPAPPIPEPDPAGPEQTGQPAPAGDTP